VGEVKTLSKVWNVNFIFALCWPVEEMVTTKTLRRNRPWVKTFLVCFGLFHFRYDIRSKYPSQYVSHYTYTNFHNCFVWFLKSVQCTMIDGDTCFESSVTLVEMLTVIMEPADVLRSLSRWLWCQMQLIRTGPLKRTNSFFILVSCSTLSVQLAK